MRAVVVAVFVLVAASAAAHADDIGTIERDVVDVAPAPGGSIDHVEIDNRLGDVRIEGHDEAGIVIYAVKRAPPEVIDRLKVSLIPDSLGHVRIETRLLPGREVRPLPRNSARVDLIVRVPRSAAVAADVWNGSVDVRNVDNGARLSANEGQIRVKRVSGVIAAHSALGRQQFVDVYGALLSQLVDGNVDMERVLGDSLDAMVHDGHIVGRQLRVRELNVRAMRGTIRLSGELVAHGRYIVSTHRGNIELDFVSPAGTRVRAHAKRGDARVTGDVEAVKDGESGALTAQLPGAELAHVDATTLFGEILVKVAAIDAAP